MLSIKPLFLSFIFICIGSMFVMGQSGRIVPSKAIGRQNLAKSAGIGPFKFASPEKSYKTFRYAPDINEEPTKTFVSTSPFTFDDIQVNSAQINFFRNKLYGVTMQIPKSELNKLLEYCEKLYGPKGRDIDDYVETTYLWHTKIKELTFYEIDKDTMELIFVDNTDLFKRLKASDSGFLKNMSDTTSN